MASLAELTDIDPANAGMVGYYLAATPGAPEGDFSWRPMPTLHSSEEIDGDSNVLPRSGFQVREGGPSYNLSDEQSLTFVLELPDDPEDAVLVALPLVHNIAFRIVLRSFEEPISAYTIGWVKTGTPNTSVVPEILSDFTYTESLEIVMDWMPGDAPDGGTWSVQQFDPKYARPGVERVQVIAEDTFLSPQNLGGTIYVDSATDVTLSLPAESEEEPDDRLPIGSFFRIVQKDDGAALIDSNAALDGSLSTTNVGDALTVQKIGSDSWFSRIGG